MKQARNTYQTVGLDKEKMFGYIYSNKIIMCKWDKWIITVVRNRPREFIRESANIKRLKK